MPLISRIMIRLSLVYLSGGVILGGLMLASKAVPFYPEIWGFLPVHIELLIFGWIIQFTMGTAYWIFPRFLMDRPRGPRTRPIMMVIMLNLGIWLSITGDLTLFPDILSGIGKLLQVLAVVIFVSLHWKRITTYRKHEDPIMG